MVKTSRGDKLVDTVDLFTGEFWTGIEGKELGLVDDIGDLRSVLKDKFGEKTEMNLISAKRGIFGGRPTPGISGLTSMNGEMIAAGLSQGFATTVEERALWAQYGL
jgi:ClpP class serine protease